MAEETQKENQKRRAGRQPSEDATGRTAQDANQPPPQEANEQTPPAPQDALDAAKPVAPGEVEPALTEPEAVREGGEVFEIAVLPLQQTTLFPGTVIPLSAGRTRSVAAVEAALATEEKLLACVTVPEGKGGPEGEATPAFPLATNTPGSEPPVAMTHASATS